MENYPKWLNNLVYFLAGIGFYGVLIYFLQIMKCIKCNSAATIVCSPDLDVKGIGMCAEHEEEVKMDLLITQFDPKGWDKFEKKYNNDRKSTS